MMFHHKNISLANPKRHAKYLKFIKKFKLKQLIQFSEG